MFNLILIFQIFKLKSTEFWLQVQFSCEKNFYFEYSFRFIFMIENDGISIEFIVYVGIFLCLGYM